MRNFSGSVEFLERRSLFAAGDRDFSFDNDGVKELDFPGAPFVVTDTALQSDGKIIVVGNKGLNMAVARLRVDGSVDTSFGNNGLFESNRRSEITSVAVHTDPANLDKIVLGLGLATDLNVPMFDLHIARLTANGGDFDNSFGLSGIAVAGDLFFKSSVRDVAIQRDGKIIAAGFKQTDLGDDTDFAIIRYTADGTADNTFGGGDALSVFAFGGADSASGVTIDYNGDPISNPRYGTIVAAGTYTESTQPERFAIARMLANGLADNSFSGDGQLLSPEVSGASGEIAEDVVVQPGGRIVVAGTASTTDQSAKNFLIAGYTPAGALDPAFGLAGSGVNEIDLGGIDDAKAIALGFHSTAGNLVISGGRDGFLAAVALTSGGNLDTRFSGDGKLTTFISGPASGLFTTGSAYAPARRIILAGGTGSVARYVDVGSIITLGTFQPQMFEQGQVPTNFVVARTVATPFAEAIVLSRSGTVTTLGPNRDLNGTNITFGDGLTTLTTVVIPANQTFVSVTLTPIDDTRIEGDETLTLTANSSSSYDAVAPNSVTMVVRDNDLPSGPDVTSSQFLFETAPQRATFRFNQDVAASISGNDFAVVGPSGDVPFDFAYDNVSNTATLSFAGILPDANYTATATAAGITNAAGQPLLADSVLNFFFLNGDANRDRRVDIGDFAILASRFNLPGTFSQGDFNYDGVTAIGDFAILASKFNQQLPAPSAFPRRIHSASKTSEWHRASSIFATDEMPSEL